MSVHSITDVTVDCKNPERGLQGNKSKVAIFTHQLVNLQSTTVYKSAINNCMNQVTTAKN